MNDGTLQRVRRSVPLEICQKLGSNLDAFLGGLIKIAHNCSTFNEFFTIIKKKLSQDVALNIYNSARFDSKKRTFAAVEDPGKTLTLRNYRRYGMKVSTRREPSAMEQRAKDFTSDNRISSHKAADTIRQMVDEGTSEYLRYKRAVKGPVEDTLPINDFKEAIVDLVRSNHFSIVTAETGSGKTTQIPKFLFEAGLGNVFCTQPRRLACSSVARRVAHEMGCRVGTVVGYHVRFDRQVSSETHITYLTDGMLLRIISLDRTLADTDIVVVDEAHERSVDTDLLMGWLKIIVARRKGTDRPLRVVITSATLETNLFATYFNAPSLDIPGRSFPIATVSVSRTPNTHELKSTIFDLIVEIHSRKNFKGDILVFMPGADDINELCDSLADIDGLTALPCYGSLPLEQQQLIFAPCRDRKCVVATNIAETSLTVPNIAAVIDPGYCKLMQYDAPLGKEFLSVMPISKAQAKQRRGRAGRTMVGLCFRIYTEGDLATMRDQQLPDILRSCLDSVVLRLVAAELNPTTFPFLQLPSDNAVHHSLQTLRFLGALTEANRVTELGMRMTNLPLSPQLAKTLTVAEKSGCFDSVVTICSLLSARGIFLRDLENDHRKRFGFHDINGDHFSLCRAFVAWFRNNRAFEFSNRNNLNHRALSESLKIRKQLCEAIGRSTDVNVEEIDRELAMSTDGIKHAFIAGYCLNIAVLNPSSNRYTTLTHGQEVVFHPSSVLAFDRHGRRNPKVVLYSQVFESNRIYIRNILVVDTKLVMQACPDMFGTKLQVIGPLGPLRKRQAKKTVQSFFGSADGQRR
ncbi:hypothetical protein PCE1_001221 [Barthelona sp. PCE]